VRLLSRLAPGDDKDELAALRIHPELNLDYPQSDIERIEPLEDRDGYELITTFFGLYGVASPLPGYYTESLLDEEWEERGAQRGFLDIIHQHLYPLLYKAWLKYRFAHNAVERGDSRYWEIIYSVLGLSSEFRQDGDLVPELLKYAGIINQRPKTTTGLKTILADYLAPMQVDVEPCVRREVSIDPAQYCKLSQQNHELGANAVIGKQVSDRSGKYVVHIGPLSVEQFQDLLGNSTHLEFIRAVTRLYLVQPLLSEVVLHLETGGAQPVCLGDPHFSSLGQSTWLVSQSNNDNFSVRLHHALN
jgi:type VI secretion system protein ImpH